jgi:tetratricopeptide (TPR) repeat protein
MTEAAIICQACGAKVRDTHVRCPRCRAVLAKAPAAQPPSSDLTGKVVAGVLVLAVAATLVVLWRGRAVPEPPPSAAASGAGRAGGPRVTPGPAALPPAPTGEIPADPAFARSSRLVDPPGAGDEAALARLRAAIAQDPQDAGALADAGRVLLALGRPQEALQPLKQAAVLQPENWGYAFRYALAAAGTQQWPEAMASFGRARSLAQDDAPTSYNLALARQKLLDYRGAAEEYKAAIGLDGAAPAARLGLAICLDRLGNAREAADAYGEYVRLQPAGPEAERAQARAKRLSGG